NYLALMDCTSLKNVYSSKRKIFWFPALSAAGCVEEVHAILSSIRKSVEILVERVNRHFVLILFDLYCMFLNVYDDLRNERGCLAFRDLERLSLVLMTQEMCEDRSDYFYYRLDRRIKHLFIDEFQDTSVIQWKVLEPIVAELTAGLGTGESPGSFFYVGDKKQAIFRFRRGESYLFDWVKDVFPEKITEKLLDVNYRSAGAIVSFVNQIFTYISKEKGYHYNSQVPYRAEEDGYIEILAVVDEEGQNTLFTLVSKKITELYDHGYSYNDIAILVRKNDTAERITRHLAQVGIPYISESKVKLFETESIRSCYHLLQYLNELHEEIYLVNFLVSQVGGYHGERLRELLRKKTLKPILKCIDGNVRIKIEKLLDMVDIVSLPHLIQSIYTLFGFFDVYGDSHNLLKFLDIAHEYSKEYPQGLFSFLEYIKQEGNEISQAKEALRDGVQVMTVHKAKGLEFEAVILPEITFDLSFNKNKGLLLFTYHDDTLLLDEVYITPTEKERSYSDTLTRAFLYEAKRVESDELNNLYVGLTRAKKALFLVGELKKRKYTHTWFNLILSSLNIGIDIDKIRAQGSMIIHTEGY
ncbi:MAG: 3'-5' exonuclease, partial [Thermodesulfobacteriota bacterium]|nr:3'-5' exonuclease [Thermodesulfobacteriota bacterium]